MDQEERLMSKLAELQDQLRELNFSMWQLQHENAELCGYIKGIEKCLNARTA